MTQQQLCWNHKMLNAIDTVSRKEQSQVKRHLQAMMYAESREHALAERKKFEQAFRHSPKTIKTVVENWERIRSIMSNPVSIGNTCGHRMWWSHCFPGCGYEPLRRGDSNRSSTRPA